MLALHPLQTTDFMRLAWIIEVEWKEQENSREPR